MDKCKLHLLKFIKSFKFNIELKLFNKESVTLPKIYRNIFASS